MGPTPRPDSTDGAPASQQLPDDSPKPPRRRVAQHQPAPPLVRPSVFQYSCRGALYLDDTDARGVSSGISSSGGDDPSSSSASSLPPPHSLRGTPRCVGVESRLRKLSDLPPSSRDAAIRDFVDQTSVEPAGGGGSSGVGGKSDRGKTTSGGSTGPLGPAPALPVLPGAADYGPPPDADGPGPPPRGRKMSGGVQILPPADKGEGRTGEDGINDGGEHDQNDETWSTLSCYGVTQVSVLMLRDQDGTSSEVAAVAPENTLGVTVRDEGDRTGGDAIATLRIGPIEVAVGNHYEFEDEQKQQQRGQRGQLQEDEEEGKDAGDFGRELGGWGRPPTAIGGDDGRRRRRDGEGRERPAIEPAKRGDPSSDRRRSRPDKEAEPQPDESTFTDRFAKTLTKTAESMKSNAKMVAGEMNDDLFPNRVYKSGERIVGQFGKTLERTGRVAKDIYKMWSNGDDDDDN